MLQDTQPAQLAVEQPPQVLPTNTNNGASTTHRVRITNIHKWVDGTDLAKTFSEQLNLTPSKVKIEMYGPKSLEKGWAEFTNEEDAKRALQLTGFKIRDQPLQVAPFIFNEPAKKEKPINKKANKPTQSSPQNSEEQANQTTTTSNNNQNDNKGLPQNNAPQQTTNATPQPNKPPPKDRPKKGAKEAPVYEEEFERLKAKYKTCKIESMSPPLVSLTLSPSDPDFPYDLEGLKLLISLPPSYPAEPCVIKITNPDDEVPARVKRNIEAATLKRAQVAYRGKPMLAGLLFWIDRNMEQLLVDKVATDDFNLAKMGIQLVVNTTSKPAPMRQITTNPDQPPLVIERSTPPSSSAPIDTITSTTTPSAENTTTETEQPPALTPTITTALKGTRIKFEEMSLCKNRVDVMNLIKSSQWAEECEKCKTVCSVSFRPEIMHEYSNIVGYLDLEGCVLFDILPSSFKAACFECNASVIFKDQAYLEAKTEKNCLQCHQKMSISLSRPAFTRMKVKRTMQIDPAVIEAKKKRKNRDPNDLLIKPGQPLPNQGTCKHYKHSFRWLRFPCCGKAFPCDICHEIQTNGEHEPKWANRMICGYCSREQNYSQKLCVACGADPTGANPTRFWEGGEGCRDKSKMSNRDTHKFKNSVLKTHSKKATRVGPKKNQEKEKEKDKK